jgi:pimeloyl-ACP methyl ester carboxylesterase
MDTVVLVHGLWMPAIALEPMRRRVARNGFLALSYSYPSMRIAFRENIERFSRFLRALNAARLHLVGHSMGGLIILRALDEPGTLPPGRVVLVGTPCAGSYAARRLRRLTGGRAMLGHSLNEWLESGPFTPKPRRDTGVIAGSLSLGLGKIVASGLSRPNDGVVSVEETRLPGMRDHIVLPVSHSGMLVSRAVARQICAFLRDGAFAHHR